MKDQKRAILGLLLGAVLAVGVQYPMSVHGAMEASEEIQEVFFPEEEGNETDTVDVAEPDTNDPDYLKRQLLAEQEEELEEPGFSLAGTSTNKTKSPFTGARYTHSVDLGKSKIIHGIDVSKWQGAIDWAKVKKAGVDFVFIRCGYTGLSRSFSTQEDVYFQRNIQGAAAQGIRIGIYYFSNARTTAEAKKEAQKTISLIKKYKSLITMPVVFDFEAFNSSYRAYGLSQSQITANTLAYFKIVKSNGFTPMYYGSTSHLPSFFNLKKLAKYDCWLAQYSTRATYGGAYNFWQYSCKGAVSGISGYVDCNFWYTDKNGLAATGAKVKLPEQVQGLKMTDNETWWIDLEWKESADADGYVIMRSDSYRGAYKRVGTIKDPEICTWTDTTVTESHGRQYYYKILPYIKKGKITYYGNESNILTAYTLNSLNRKIKTTTQLNLRSQAGTEYTALIKIPKGKRLVYNLHTYSVNGRKWYRIQYRKKGKTYTGYISSYYVKQLGV